MLVICLLFVLLMLILYCSWFSSGYGNTYIYTFKSKTLHIVGSVALLELLLMGIYVELWVADLHLVSSVGFFQTECAGFGLWFIFPYIYIYMVITGLTLLYVITYNMKDLESFFKFLSVMFISGLGLFMSDSFLVFFMFYELLLLPSFYVLYSYAKTRKAMEAAFLMFFWTQLGAMCLFFTYISLFMTTSSVLFSSISLITLSSTYQFVGVFMLLIGFGVKFPMWPFYEWLPKAHVESSTNFSIFLSGVLVKFAFFGFYKSLYHFNSNMSVMVPYLWLIVGIFDVATKLYYQIDLKKLIAYATTVEMHWLCLALLNGQTVLWFSVYAMLMSHALLSSNFFFAVDSVTRRFKTRLMTEISGMMILLPKLYLSMLILLITFLGFPGSLFFMSEFLFFAFMVDMNLVLAGVLLFLLYFFVISCYFKNWFFLLFGYSYRLTGSKLTVDLDNREFVLFMFITLFVFVLGLLNTFLF